MFHLDVKNLTHVAFQDLQKSLLVPGRQPFFYFLLLLLFFNCFYMCCHVTPWRKVSRLTSDLDNAMLL